MEMCSSKSEGVVVAVAKEQLEVSSNNRGVGVEGVTGLDNGGKVVVAMGRCQRTHFGGFSVNQ
jgi:hypothetical protein